MTTRRGHTRTIRRTVITGVGCISPNGIGREAYWAALAAGRSGVSRISSFDTTQSIVKIAAEIKEFNTDLYIPAKDRRHISRPVPLALAASEEAWVDAGLVPIELTLEARRRTGVFFGSGGGPLEFTERQYGFYFNGRKSQVSVYAIPSSTTGTLSSELSMYYHLHGPSHVISTGCTSSTDALGYAAQMIALGHIDIALAGGADAPIMPGIMSGFELMKIVTTAWNHAPDKASRPFSRDRSGIVAGEGAWFFILEAAESALARGAHIYAELAGYGTSCDAHHRVRLDESGEEPARAMQLAVTDAGLAVDAIDYINLHGTSTQLNDPIETRAVKRCFGKHAFRIPMSATKSLIGHPQGASGAAGVAAALLALTKDIIHPTINLEQPDGECDLDYVPQQARHQEIETVLCNCIGFGSKNSALVLRKVSDTEKLISG
ncbi:MAG: beta-ketoacyl-[acyl-carrier-protein] synthase family protein [Acidobacteriota bacterium]